MPMKKTMVLFLCALAVCLTSRAQIAYAQDTPIDSLIPGPKSHVDEIYWLMEGTERDDVTASLTIFNRDASRAAAAGNVEEAMENYRKMHDLWWTIFSQAPLCNNKWMYVSPCYMFNYLITNELDQAVRMRYFADMMTMFKTRIANLEKLNAMQMESNKRSEGVVKCLWAYYYYALAPLTFRDSPKDSKLKTNYKKAYEMFRDGIRNIKAEGGRGLEPYALHSYIDLSYNEYRNDAAGFKENFLNDYQDCRAVCDSMLNEARDPNFMGDPMTIIDRYDPILSLCDSLFYTSGAADSASIVTMLTPKIEASRNNVDYLEKALALLQNNGLDNCDCYYKASEYIYAVRPTYRAAIGMAKRRMDDKDISGALNLYRDAISMADNDNDRAQVAMAVANSLKSARRYSEALTYLDDAARYNPAIRGKALFRQAMIHVDNEQYSKARDLLSKAKMADETLTGEVNRRVAMISRIEEQIIEYRRAKRAYDAARAAKQAEEDFWTKGKQ